MPMPSWWGHINKRVFNPRALRSGKWQVIDHVGRTSGRSYRTPIEALPVDDGYLIMLVYGSRSDWVRNVLAAGRATLEVDGEIVELVDPQVITGDDAFERLPPGSKRPPRLLMIDEFLAMRRADPHPAT
jgi:deazaflavin-dependent oxidoreductase (nitroreductase family)